MSEFEEPRIRPLPADEWDDRIAEALVSMMPAEPANPKESGNLLATLVRHPDLAGAYLPFNAYLLRNSRLSPRAREVAILRVAHRTQCRYLWSHHVSIALETGLTVPEMIEIRVEQCSDEKDELVVRAVDDLARYYKIAQPTWSRLCQHFSDEELMDLVVTIGGYFALAMVVSSLQIEEDET